MGITETVKAMQQLAENNGYECLILVYNPDEEADDAPSMAMILGTAKDSEGPLAYIADVVDAVMRGRISADLIDESDVH